MSIRKSKSTSVDIHTMFSNVDTNEQIEKERKDSNEYLQTIRTSTAMLRSHSEKLINCVDAEKDATKALNAAADSCDNAVTGICKAIVDAQQNTVFKTTVDPKHLAQVQKTNNEFLTKEEQQLADHRAKQADMLAKHEERMKKILSRGRGFWISDFWAKVLGIVLLVYTLTCFLYAKFG